MVFGPNLQHLRKKHGMTQEKLGEQLGVSRQTVSKWESGEASPELGKLLDLCGIFSCSLDNLLRQDLTVQTGAPVRIVRVKSFRVASYTVVSPRAEEDVFVRLDTWARDSGLLAVPDYLPRRIGWAYPWVSQEQKQLGMKGYSGGYLLPEGFAPQEDWLEIRAQKEETYGVLTVELKKGAPAPKASQFYPVILEQLQRMNVKKSAPKGVLAYFERKYEKNGVPCMDVFVHCEGGNPEEMIQL